MNFQTCVCNLAKTYLFWQLYSTHTSGSLKWSTVDCTKFSTYSRLPGSAGGQAAWPPNQVYYYCVGDIHGNIKGASCCSPSAITKNATAAYRSSWRITFRFPACDAVYAPCTRTAAYRSSWRITYYAGPLSCNFRGARSCIRCMPKLSKTKLETLRLLLLAVGSYPRARATRAACMEKIYEIPCAWAAWDLCAGSLLVKSTVLLLSVFWCNLVDPCILKTNRSKFTSNLDPVYGDACSAKSFGVRASRSWSYEIWLSIVWRLGWSWCSKAGEWTAKLFCIANHSAGLQVFGDLISLPCRGRAAAPRKAQKRPPGHAPGQSLFYSSFFTWKSPIWYATNGDFHYLFLSKSFSP